VSASHLLAEEVVDIAGLCREVELLPGEAREEGVSLATSASTSALGVTVGSGLGFADASLGVEALHACSADHQSARDTIYMH